MLLPVVFGVTLNYSKFVLRLKSFHGNIFQDILENDDIQLDMVFKNSLMLDLAEVSIITLNAPIATQVV